MKLYQRKARLFEQVDIMLQCPLQLQAPSGHWPTPEEPYPTQEAESLPVLREEEVVHSLKAGKFPAVDNIPFELFQTRGEATTTVLTVICKLCHSYCTIRLISHPSKVILRVILNELTIKAEKLLAEEQEGFRPDRSTVEQIFNSSVIIEGNFNTSAICPSTSQTSKMRLTESSMQVCGRSSEASTQRETGPSHSFTIFELQQCSPSKQLAMAVLQGTVRCPSGVLTHTHPVQLVPREDLTGNRPWPPHIQFH